MTSFLLKANEILALLIFSHLNIMATELAVAFLCPPLLPLVPIFWITSIILFRDEASYISQKCSQDINSYETNDTSLLSAIWSTIASGFSIALWVPNVKIFDVLTARDKASTLVPSFFSNRYNSTPTNNNVLNYNYGHN